MAENIKHQVEEKVTYITIDEAENGNRVSDAMAQKLTALLDAAGENCKAVVLWTSGDDFCLGRAVMGERPGQLPEAFVLRERFDTVFNFYNAFRRSKIPIIGRVQGKALGFGCAMAALCDITICTDTSQYQLPETSHGIMPTMAMSALIDRVGRKAITYMTYAADFITAQHALAVGIVSQVVPEDELDSTMDHVVNQVKNIPMPAVHAVKEYATYSIGQPITVAEQYARNLHATINSSEAMREK